MAIFELGKNKEAFLEVIEKAIRSNERNVQIWDAIKLSIANEKEMNVDAFSTLYYHILMVYYASKKSEIDNAQLKSVTYLVLLRSLYITWMLEKPHGKDYFEGNMDHIMDFEEERKELGVQFKEMKKIATEYIPGLDQFKGEILPFF